jgi:hypothetical protein
MDIFIRDDYDEEVKPKPLLSPDLQSKQKPTAIRNLDVGDRFEIPVLLEVYKNLYLVGLSNSSATVKGEYRYDKEEPFKTLPRGFAISLNTIVKKI